MADPIHQFQIVNYFPLGKIGSVNLAFTKLCPLHGHCRRDYRLP